MVTITNQKDLNDFSMAQLVEIYNGLPHTTEIKKFSDRKTAIRRTWAALEEHAASEEMAPPASNGETKRRGRAANFNYPVVAPVKGFREGTKRAEVIGILSKGRGATLEQIMEKIGWDRRTACEGIRLLHSQLGYGLAQDDNGYITLFDS